MTRHVTRATIFDAVPFLYSQEQADAIIAGYPEHERDARGKGLPQLGSGRVFPIADEKISEPPFQLPRHWPRLNGIDFGWDHPFGAVQTAWDRDADCIHVTRAFKQREAIPAVHVAAVRPWGSWVPCAWPHDGYQHDKGSGDELASGYRKHGLEMLSEHATHQEGGFGVEAGITEMLERMMTGRLKVFANLGEWFDEFRIYHRKDGIIVKEFDDLMSATRIAIMMRRFAAIEPKRDLDNWRDMAVA